MNLVNKKVKVAFIYRCIAFLITLFAIFFQQYVNTLVSEGFMVNHLIFYYTTETNILTCFMFGLLIFKSINFKERRIEEARVNPSLHLATAFYITITMIGFWILLAPSVGKAFRGFTLVNNLLIHTLVPILMIIDVAFFSKHGDVKYKEIIKWLIYPFCYLIFIFSVRPFIKTPYYSFPVKGEMFDLWYPYPFLEPAIIGRSGLVISIISLISFFILFAFFYIYIDKKLAKKRS